MITFTKHAKIRLQSRGISQALVVQTIKHADVITLSRANRRIALKTFAKLALKVVFVKERSDIIIVTAYWVRPKGQRVRHK